MMEAVTAVRFDRPMTNGRTRPCLLACERANGEEVEVVAKFSEGAELKAGALAAEAIAAMLAADLGLMVPEPLVVSLDDGFIDLVAASHRELAEFMRRSSRLAFGSRKLPPGFATFPAGAPIAADLRQAAAEIFAFDCLIENWDRRITNPNLLSDGRSFAIIDHELAFVTVGVLFRQPPWKLGALTPSTCGSHALFQGLTGRQYDFSRLQSAWEAVTEERLQAYRATLPAEWMSAGATADAALALIADVRDHIRPALAEVTRALS
jgi:hypothetical protein